MRPRACWGFLLGIEAHQALDWDKGIRVFSTGRIYPERRIVLYRPSEMLANAKNPRTAWVQGERVALARVEQVIDPRYLSLLERERLKDLQSGGVVCQGDCCSDGARPRRSAGNCGATPLAGTATCPTTPTEHPPSGESVRGPRSLPPPACCTTMWKRSWQSGGHQSKLVSDFGETFPMQAVYGHLHGELKHEMARSLRRGRSARKTQRAPHPQPAGSLIR